MAETKIDKSAVALAEKTSYTNKEIKYLRNVEISEWDIKSAGLSVLKYRKLVPDEMIKEFEAMDKKTRTIKEGLLQKKNPEIAREILETLAKARQAFIAANGIPEKAILSIKKDALFLIDQHPTVSKIKEFEFRQKNIYTSYLNIGGKEFYYSSKTDGLDVKGLSEETRIAQKDYLLNDIRNFMKMGEKLDGTQMFNALKSYRAKYLNRKLPLETYGNMNDDGLFRIGDYSLKVCGPNELEHIDITQNYINYLLPIFDAML